LGAGIRLKTILREKKMTIKQLALLADVPLNTLYSITKRDSDRIDPVILLRISDALDVPVWQIIPAKDQEPDYDYEEVCEVLANSGLSIEATGHGAGPDSDGDTYYIWHTDVEDPEEERVEYAFRDLLRIVKSVERDAELRVRDYIRKRLNAELF